LAQSSKRLIESKIAGLGLGHRFKIFNDKIETPGDGLIIFRGLQAADRKIRDDIAGAIVTGGTSTAYTISSFEVFDTLAHLNGQMISVHAAHHQRRDGDIECRLAGSQTAANGAKRGVASPAPSVRHALRRGSTTIRTVAFYLQGFLRQSL